MILHIDHLTPTLSISILVDYYKSIMSVIILSPFSLLLWRETDGGN